jgi:hypothetical protein
VPFREEKAEDRGAVTLTAVADRRCASCGKLFTGRADARTCGATCRQRLDRQQTRTLPWQAIAHRLESTPRTDGRCSRRESSTATLTPSETTLVKPSRLRPMAS